MVCVLIVWVHFRGEARAPLAGGHAKSAGGAPGWWILAVASGMSARGARREHRRGRTESVNGSGACTLRPSVRSVLRPVGRGVEVADGEEEGGRKQE
jgi:hypothetical protein